MQSNVVLATGEFDVVGTRPIRHDGTDKVTGRAQYGADVHLPGLLYGAVLRSPHAHARIKSIDASAAMAIPGVKAVATAADLPQPSGETADLGEGAMSNPKFLSNNVLAAEKALYKGHAVAAVAADSPHLAEEALSAIRVEYEVLPEVTDVLKAMEENSPLLHERLETFSFAGIQPGGLRSDDSERGTNVSNHFVLEKGSPAEGFANAHVTVEREYRTATVHQGYIEPHSATALWNKDGELTIWCSSQGHFAIRDNTALVLDIPVSQIKVIPLEIGGGFGGKLSTYLEAVAAILSKKSGQPVKMTMNRAEVFEGTGPTSGSYMKVKMASDREGRITAAEALLVYEGGAFPGAPISAGAQCIFGAYDIPNARVEAYDVVINKPKTSAYRAPGAPAAAFAAETVIDELCEKLSMDPLEFRLRNAATEGTRQISGVAFPRIGYVETVKAAQEHPHYSAPLTGPNRGRGIATGFWRNNTGPSTAFASVNSDGTVSLVEGSPDIGGTRVVAAMHVAEVLTIPVEDVHPQVADTDSIGYTSSTGGSSVAFKTGWACYEAAQDIKRQMIGAGRDYLGRGRRRRGVEGRLARPLQGPGTKNELQGACGNAEWDGRPHSGAGVCRSSGRRRSLRSQHSRRGGGPGDGQGPDSAVHRRSGRGKGGPSRLRGGSDSGRRGTGHRLGPQRRVFLRRERTHDQLYFPGLPDANLAGPADDRHGNRRSPEPGSSLRGARRRRGPHRCAYGCHR